MTAKLFLRIITPERVVLEQEVNEVVATAIDGQFAVLPNHEPLLTALSIDMLRWKIDSQERSAAVMGGVLEVNANEVTVLSDLAELDHEVDEASAHQEKERLEAEKIQKVDKLESYVSQLAIARSLARLKVAEHHKLRRGRHTQI